ncbi:TetR/AcrR family transcriptional regulator [Mycolicibacterium pallens]|uniref:TetR/AcrR family transcriptional regulator n=1 Tax=Mycolicibacterium pallens TaxID=370524 RepID=A0ABX8VKP3_9MYCO|nr:TetR/AcrR family transcriptional regulator [Mycolicibacterium pallens]APE16151.1 TetR family transcriptional regulator [Mycobacterium sp. WY10]QYL18377.1 TetR/AcrR family transcriptional regulator [Mycolicibacterium pallens]
MTTAARKDRQTKPGPRRATASPKVDDGGTRQRLVEATAQIMHDEGYAAATSRRVATKAGVKQALVYYYFPTMDDLFLAVLRSGAEVALEQLRKVLTEEDPLRALWRINSDPRQTVMSTELMALANHRKVIGAELRNFAERVRDIETAAVTMSLRSYGVDLEAYPPVVISMLVAQIARSVGNENAVGLTRGHDELEKFVQAHFAMLSGKQS